MTSELTGSYSSRSLRPCSEICILSSVLKNNKPDPWLPDDVEPAWPDDLDVYVVPFLHRRAPDSYRQAVHGSDVAAMLH